MRSLENACFENKMTPPFGCMSSVDISRLKSQKYSPATSPSFPPAHAETANESFNTISSNFLMAVCQNLTIEPYRKVAGMLDGLVRRVLV